MRIPSSLPVLALALSLGCPVLAQGTGGGGGGDSGGGTTGGGGSGTGGSERRDKGSLFEPSKSEAEAASTGGGGTGPGPVEGPAKALQVDAVRPPALRVNPERNQAGPSR